MSRAARERDRPRIEHRSTLAGDTVKPFAAAEYQAIYVTLAKRARQGRAAHEERWLGGVA